MKLKKGQKSFISLPLTIKSIDKANYTLTMVASTQDVDRHGDTVIQSGWIQDEFLKNPVILNSHNYGDATEVIANAVRSEVVGKGKRSKLEQDWKFAVNENPKAKIIFDLYAGGFLHASSVGFIPRKFKENQDGTRDWYTIEEAELLEVSAVSVPANARALAKSKGIDVDILEKEYDEDDESDDDGLSDPDNDETKGNTDEVPKDNEVPNLDEQTPSGDDNDRKDGEGTPDADAGQGAGDPTSEVDVPVEEEKDSGEEVKPDEVIPEAKSYKQKVVSAIGRIDDRERNHLNKVSEIIKSLLEDGQNVVVDQKTVDQIRKRKVNQAIRMLFKTR